MAKHDVFISYKSEEYDQAKWLRSVLENSGISCWMAPESIVGGASYASEIPRAIRQADAFVLVLSAQAQLSKWVTREVDMAINEGKLILPFMLENCPLQDDFSFYLTNVQRYAAYENKEATAERMIQEIKAIAPEVQGTTPCAPVPCEPTPSEEKTVLPPNTPWLERFTTDEVIPLYCDPFRLGRSEARCDYVITGNGGIGRLHAWILQSGGCCYLVDGTSVNKTYLNSVELIPQKEYLLSEGDTILLMNEKFIFHDGQESEV